jgi:cellulose synthase (UDP-forming)
LPTYSADSLPPVANESGLYLPEPPSDAERDSYFARKSGALMFFATLSFIGVAFSMIRLVQAESVFAFCLIYFVAYALSSVLAIVGYVFTHDVSKQDHRRRVAEWSPAATPSVDVWLPVCGEPLPVLLNTWRHAQKLEWPGELRFYIADDAANPALADFARQLGFEYGTRAEPGWMKKAGNLRFLQQSSGGDFCLVLDADFAVRPDLLLELMPYFDDRECGIVQSPQFFRTTSTQNWLENGASAVQEMFYRLIQTSRDQREAAICVGTNALYRRAALDSIGGATLVEHSEDVHTGFDMRAKGWKLRYVPVNLAAGRCPADERSFLRQQYRWCSGSMSLLASKKFWRTPMRAISRTCYAAGFSYYIATAISAVVFPILPLMLIFGFPQLVQLDNYLLLLPALFYAFALYPLWHHSRFGLAAWTVRLIYSWAHLFAIFDRVRGRSLGWHATGSATRGGGDRTRLLNVAMIGGTGLPAAVALLGAIARATERPLAFIPMILLSGFSLVAVARAYVPSRTR